MTSYKYKVGDIVCYEATGCPKNHFLITSIEKSESRPMYNYIMLESGRANRFLAGSLEALTTKVA